VIQSFRDEGKFAVVDAEIFLRLVSCLCLVCCLRIMMFLNVSGTHFLPCFLLTKSWIKLIASRGSVK
jgi:hypothetical protein